MNKVLLIIYMLGAGTPTKYNPEFTFQEFQTIAQCDTAVAKMKKIADKWHFGDDKEDIIPSLYTTTCWEVPGYKEDYHNGSTSNSKVQPIKPKDNVERRTTRRWNDL